MTAEMVVLTPLLVLIALAAIAFGRLESAAAQVSDAARGAAEAAVIWPTTDQANDAAEETAAYALSSDGITCDPYTVNLDTSDWQPGGNLSVTVSCTVSFAEVALPGMPGSRTLTQTVVAPIETYRALG